MRRREVVGGLCALPFANAGPAQAQKLPKLAILSPTSKVGGHSDLVYAPFTGALAELGWIAGRNIEIEERFAEDKLERLPALAAELVALKPDVIFTNTVNGANAAVEATRTIPIVVGPAGENLFVDLAGNFARPVGNVTGLTLHSPEQDEKCLELLKEAAPAIARVGILVNPLNPVWKDFPGSLRGDALGLALVRMEARGVDEVDAAFSVKEAAGIDGVHVPDDATLAGRSSARRRIIAQATGRRVPVVSTHVAFARDGALLALGTDIPALARRGASYVDKILKGAKPGDLPVERPTRFELAINLKTAKALGITVPLTLQTQADEVIE